MALNRRDKQKAVTQVRREQVSDWKPLQALEGVIPDFVFISIDDAERQWSPGEETFYYYELVYVYAGELRMWLAGEPMEGKKGDLFVTKPGVPHREESPPGRTSQLLCLATAFKNKKGKRCEFPLDLPDRVRLKPGHIVERCLRAIASEAYHRTLGYAAAINAYIVQIFIELVRTARSVEAPDVDVGEIRRQRLASEAVQFIEENYAAPLTLPEIAQHFFMSPYHFSRIFKENTNLSPIAHLTRTRMENAKRLLLDPDRTVKAIATQVGYHDPHYFTKAFAKEEGMTPTAYRRKHLR
ncbi:MAG: AraC family transcriptional regulator [Planctomycetes bacterium]|nr:AraC family transcriptional regulator [Planctomycetota bacterium]